MSLSLFSTIPAWLSKPYELKNVINNPFSSLVDVPTFTHLQDSSRFSSGLRQALYWRKQLSPSASSHTVIFTFLGSHGLCLPNVLEVSQALKSICNTLLITEVYRPANSNFIGISFSSHHEASRIRQLFTYYKDSVVIHVPSSSSMIHNFKLLWLPPLFPDSRINHFLDKHSAFHQFTRDSMLTDTNLLTPTNSVSGTLRLHPNSDVQLLPHLIPLPAPHLGHALFIISGRPPYCLRCGLTGHVRRSCLVPRCSSCHHYHQTSAACLSHSPPLDSALTDIWNDDISLNPAESTSTTISDTHPPISTSDNISIGPSTTPSWSDSSDFLPHHSLTSSTQSSLNSIQPFSHVPKCDRTFANVLKNASPSPTLPTLLSASHVNVIPPTNLEVHLSSLTPPSMSSSQTVPSSPSDTSQHVQTSMDCSPPASPSICSANNTSANSTIDVVLISASQHSSHSTSLSKRPRKRHKRHSSTSSSTSSQSATIHDNVEPSHSSWADQVEEDSTLVTLPHNTDAHLSVGCLSPPSLASHASFDTLQATISVLSDTPHSAASPQLSTPLITVQTTPSDSIASEDSDESQEMVYNPLLLVFLAAKAAISHKVHIAPDVFQPSANRSTSHAFVTCSCNTAYHVDWPIKASISCRGCSEIITFQHRQRFFLLPQLPYICLILSPEDHTDPFAIDYLLSSLKLKVPLVPYITYPKPRTLAFLQSFNPPLVYIN